MPFSFTAATAHPLRRVSVRTIAVVVAAVVVLATAGLAYVTYLGGQHRSEMNSVVEREMVIEERYEDIRAAVITEGATAAVYLALRDPQYLTDFEEQKASAEAAFSELRQAVLGGDSEELARLEELQAEHDRIANAYAEFTGQLASGNDAGALLVLLEEDVETGARSINEKLKLASDDAAIRLLAAQQKDEAAQATWNRIVLIGAVIWALVIAVGAFVAVRWVLRPMARVEKATRAMAAGDLSVRVPPVALRELDELATSFNTMAENLEESTNRLEHAATTDGLTGLYNHRWLQDALTREVERSVRYGHPLSVLMMDVDGFKLFNDTYGHQAGDDVLRQVADVLRKTSRTGDIVSRYGGDEFVAILPNTDRDGAVSMADRILDSWSRERVHTGQGDDLPLTVSIGLAACPEDSQHKQELLAYADASLYEAKQVSGSSLRASRGESREVVGYRDTSMGVLDSLVRGIDSKDSYTRQHSQQDADLAVELGSAMGLAQEPLRALRIAGLLHDVGKIGVPDHLLKKPGSLTDEECRMMQEHVVLGKLIIQGVPNLQDVVEAVYTHHERWDGTGYPQGLKDEEIPLLGRVLAVADAYSAMILDRPYRKALSHEEAVAELRRCAGTQLDPELVEPFVSLLERQRRAA
jgi:diguanylate cyclase (GGDEF)-like protein